MPSSSSFFDQNHQPQSPFSFVSLDLSHFDHINKPSKAEAHLTCTNLSSKHVLKGFFKLQSHFIFYYNDEQSESPLLALDILYARLGELEIFFSNPKYKVKLTKKTASFELAFHQQSCVEQWMDALRSVCIMSSLHEKYNGIRLLGQGAFGAVHLVKSVKTGEPFAVKGFAKINLKNQQSKLAIINEIAMMRAHDHPNLVKLHEVHETEGSIYLVIDYIAGQTLRSFLSKPDLPPNRSESQNIQIMSSILNSLAYFESQGSMHRDLKPENILMDKQGNLRIIDFGLVAYCDQSDYIFDRCGTPGYIAPEIFNFKKRADGRASYDGKCDVFSAACILFQVLFGFRLFNGKDSAGVLQLNKNFNYEQIQEIIQAEIDQPKSKVNKNGLDLLLKMLQPNATKRISACEALQHNYFAPVAGSLPKSLGSRDLVLNSFRKSKPSVESSVMLSSHLQYSANQCLHTLSGDQNPPSFRIEEEQSFHVNGKPAGSSESETAASMNSHRFIIPFQGSTGKKSAAKFPLSHSRSPKTSIFKKDSETQSPPKSSFKMFSQPPSTGDVSSELVETESDDSAQIRVSVEAYKAPIFLKQAGKMLSLKTNMQRK